MHYRDYFPLIRKNVLQKWEQSWHNVQNNKLRSIKASTKSWTSSAQKNRWLEVMLCRLRLGHVRAKHEWILKRGQPPVCQHCSGPLTVRHALAECDYHTQLRHTIYPQTVGMREQDTLSHILAESNEQFNTTRLMNYLTGIGFINSI